MHERVEADVPALLLALVIVVLVSLGLVHQVRLRAARQVEIRKLQQILAAEAERAEEAAVEEYTSMLATRSLCAVCETPTNSRCSRCKSVHYCSATCQIKHWRQGHKNECGGGSQNLPTIPLAVQGTRKSASNTDLSITAHTKPIRAEPTKTTAHTKPIQAEPRRVQPQISDPRVEPTSDGCLAKPKKILFPYDRFVMFFNWDIQRPPCGLINCGNSCFANVILQCLTYTRPLAAFLLEGNHHRECQRNDWCFMCELQDHVWRVFNSQIPFSPIRILSRLRNIGNHLGYGRQEDAHEFMRFAVDSMQSTCLDEFGGEKSVDSRSQETTLVQYIFGGHLQSQVKCMQCGHESNRYENMMDLAVEIQGAVESLEDGLAQFTAPEWLDGENKYKCDRCNAYVKASKRLTIHEAPNILTIALKRFQSGKFGKLNKRVTFPETLNMSPYMSGEGDKPPLYKLYAVVVHVDMLNASFFGHYICYVRDMEGTWYKVDDSKVKEVDLEKVMSQKAYMLMYSRSFARPSPEPDAGSLASSLMDTSAASGRECSSSLCKYQRSSSIGQVHGEVHRMSPIIAGTLVDNRVVEESVDCSYSSLQSSAIERVISLDSSMVHEPSVSDSNTGSSLESDTVSSPAAENLSHEILELSEVSWALEADNTSQSHFYRKAGKRRLETEIEATASKPFAFPGLTRSRSSSCPPVARSHSSSMDTYQLADDLPRTFGYSLCKRDTESGCSLAANEVQTPSKRQHLLQTNVPEAMDNISSMDVVDVDIRVKEPLNSDMILQRLGMDGPITEVKAEDAAICVSNGSLEGISLSLDGSMEEMESVTNSTRPEVKVEMAPESGALELESELSNGTGVAAIYNVPATAASKKQIQHEENGNLKPIFAKGFLNRSRKANREPTNSNAHTEPCIAGPSKSPSLKDSNERANGSLENWAENSKDSDLLKAARQKQGRNDSCSCGSQRKWNKCCGRVDMLKEIETRRLVA